MRKAKAAIDAVAAKKKRSQATRTKSMAVWMPRREACEQLAASISTLRNWEGKRFRVKRAPRASGSTPVVYYHRDDVERVRLEKLGPREWEIERTVLDALAKGEAPIEVLAKMTHVTLADVERIRDHDARLRGACLIAREQVAELRKLLELDEVFRGETLVAHVRALVLRVENLAQRLASSRQTPAQTPPKASPSEPPKAANGSN